MISPKVRSIEGNPDSGIQENFTRGMWNPRFWNTESRQRLESAWNPESKTVLDYLIRGDKVYKKYLKTKIDDSLEENN